MATSVIDFQISDACAAGGHGTITMRQDGSPIGSRREFIESLKEEAANVNPKPALWDLALEMIRLTNPSTLAELKTLINTMTITVDF
jgi:hypothetical protein